MSYLCFKCKTSLSMTLVVVVKILARPSTTIFETQAVVEYNHIFNLLKSYNKGV